VRAANPGRQNHTLWPFHSAFRILVNPQTLDARPRTLAFVHFKNSPFSKTGGKLVFLRAFFVSIAVFDSANAVLGRKY
jgi:hypothetical protein